MSSTPGASHRLYYDDSYLRRFQATAEAGADPQRIYLDRTAFYPTSGGQPFDKGTINGVAVVDVIDEDDRIAHITASALAPGALYDCEVDWLRRFDHMQQHTGQHLLSAVLADAFRLPTVSFHLGDGSATIDIEAADFSPKRLLEAESRVNAAVFENRAVTVSYHDSREPIGLRKPSDREGVIRVVTIEGLDRSACGGTHVASTAEIGPLFIRGLDKVRGNVRIEFLCGHRAIARAQADYAALSTMARRFSAPIDETPALAASQAERLAEAEKLARKLAGELAAARGRELHAATAVNAGGLRLHVRQLAKGPIADEVRQEAQAFVAAGGQAIFAALCSDPASILLCASPEAPVKAGAALKPVLEKYGGRGGGNAAMAQGSVPTAEALREVWNELSSPLA